MGYSRSLLQMLDKNIYKVYQQVASFVLSACLFCSCCMLLMIVAHAHHTNLVQIREIECIHLCWSTKPPVYTDQYEYPTLKTGLQQRCLLAPVYGFIQVGKSGLYVFNKCSFESFKISSTRSNNLRRGGT